MLIDKGNQGLRHGLLLLRLRMTRRILVRYNQRKDPRIVQPFHRLSNIARPGRPLTPRIRP